MFPVERLAECARRAIERVGRVALNSRPSGGLLPCGSWIGESHGVEPGRVLITPALLGLGFVARQVVRRGGSRSSSRRPTIGPSSPELGDGRPRAPRLDLDRLRNRSRARARAGGSCTSCRRSTTRPALECPRGAAGRRAAVRPTASRTTLYGLLRVEGGAPPLLEDQLAPARGGYLVLPAELAPTARAAGHPHVPVAAAPAAGRAARVFDRRPARRPSRIPARVPARAARRAARVPRRRARTRARPTPGPRAATSSGCASRARTSTRSSSPPGPRPGPGSCTRAGRSRPRRPAVGTRSPGRRPRPAWRAGSTSASGRRPAPAARGSSRRRAASSSRRGRAASSTPSSASRRSRRNARRNSRCVVGARPTRTRAARPGGGAAARGRCVGRQPLERPASRGQHQVPTRRPGATVFENEEAWITWSSAPRPGPGVEQRRRRAPSTRSRP